MEDKSKEDDIPVIATELNHQFPTPEVNYNYVNSSLMLPIGNNYTRGKDIRQKRYADGNSIGRMNDKHILDTRKYGV